MNFRMYILRRVHFNHEVAMIKKLLLAFFLLVSSAAQAVTVTAKVAADDYFSVFVGDAGATSLTFVGGSGNATWPSQGAPFTFNLGAGEYIYVAAWDSADFGPPHMFIGEFDIGGTTLLTNTTDWVSTYDPSIKDPSTSQVQALAQSATWTTPGASTPNGSCVAACYGTLLGGSAADRIWYDVFSGGVTQNGYALFTNAPLGGNVAAIPEPETYAMMLAGLGLLGFAARRRKQKEAAAA
jgi:hypothetical protein